MQGTKIIRAVLFDFGGVLAEEGFREGLKAIALENGLDPDAFFRTSEDLIHSTGYVIGSASEKDFWEAVRKETGISQADEYLRGEILRRFVVRPEVLRYADRIRAAGRVMGILSDQTDWLDELDKAQGFSSHFDNVFNSFHLGKSKRDPSVFRDVCSMLCLTPGEVLFVDDNRQNILRASDSGLAIVHFTDIRDFEKKIKKAIPDL